ncbi:MAG: ABC transporter substrate-binding protein [Bacteroides thetaiotaomicron]|nr:ABC transporter substrate-binding protein [Bacteroides thetaiotaomicron]
MNTQKLIAAILTILIVVSLCGCGETVQSESKTDSGYVAEVSEKADQTGSKEVITGEHSWSGEYTYIDTVPGSWLKCGLMSDPKTFGPFDTNTGGGRTMLNMAVYEPLAYLNPQGELEGAIMKNYERVGDLTYRIEIYDYVHDSQGNAIDASDIVFSFEKCAELGNWATYTAVFESITQTGDYEVELKLNQERPDSLSGLLENVMIVSKKAYEENDSMAAFPIGTGAYVLEDYSAGAYMTFLVNDDYWQTNSDLVAFMSYHNVERYTIEFITSKSQHSIALEAGEIDITNSITSSDNSNFVETDGVTPLDGYDYCEVRRTGMGCLIFNCSSDSVCGDVNLRKAIAYILDRSAIAYAGYGAAGIYFDSFSQPEFLDYATDYAPEGGYYSYDENLAKEYLENSNYKGETIKLYIQNELEWSNQAEVIRSLAEEIGINIEVVNNEKVLHESLVWTNSDAEWDMALVLFLRGDYTYTRLAQVIDANYYESGGCTLQIIDPTLQELFDTAVDISTFSYDNTKKLLDYIAENCYCLPMCDYTQRTYWSTDSIKVFAGRRDGYDPLPGACVPVVKE